MEAHGMSKPLNLFLAIGTFMVNSYKGDEFVKKCQIDDLNEPFTIQTHFRMLINRKRQMKPYQLHLIFDFLISLLPPGEDVSPIANVVYEYHQSNENQHDINLVLDFIKSISSRGTVLFTVGSRR